MPHRRVIGEKRGWCGLGGETTISLNSQDKEIVDKIRLCVRNILSVWGGRRFGTAFLNINRGAAEALCSERNGGSNGEWMRSRGSSAGFSATVRVPTSIEHALAGSADADLTIPRRENGDCRKTAATSRRSGLREARGIPEVYGPAVTEWYTDSNQDGPWSWL